MLGVTSFLFNTLTAALFGPEMDDVDSITPPHGPSIGDVLIVKDLLFRKLRLPLEIIDVVIDFAEYWPHTSTIRTGGEEIKVRAGRPLTENQLILRSYPLGYVPRKDNPAKCSMSETGKLFPAITPTPWTLPEDFPQDETHKVLSHLTKRSRVRGEFPCRKVIFTIKSHDQGWGGQRDQRGTYKGSYTWFEAGHERLIAFSDTHNASSPGSKENNSIPDRNKWLGEGITDLESLPQFSLLLDADSTHTTSQDAIKNPTSICTLHTISPKIESRITAHEPPQTETWFSHALMPSNDCIQKNLTATKESQLNIIEWRYDDDINPESLDAKNLDDQGRGPASKTGEYVRNLKVGDSVTVWAKARFPMWVNTIEEVKIDVYWAV